jgi:hypothetical protein
MRTCVQSVHGIAIEREADLLFVTVGRSTLVLFGGPDALRLVADCATRAAMKLEAELPVHPEAAEYAAHAKGER